MHWKRERRGTLRSFLADRGPLWKEVPPDPLRAGPSLGLVNTAGFPTALRVRSKVLSSLHGLAWAVAAPLS